MKKHAINCAPKSLAAAVALVTASLAAPTALAVTDVNQITVTAQKREESLQEVPISISVTSQEQLERDQIYSLIDLQRTAPALEVNNTAGGENNGGARIRGVGTTILSESSSASVAVVVDQVPSGNIPAFPIFDLGQVEVLKGPQGTLFGQTASVGVLNVTTAAPTTDEFSANIGADYQWDDYDQTLVRGHVNIPLSDTTAVRFAGRFRNEEGLQRNVYTGDDNEHDEVAFRGRLRSQLTDQISLDLIAEYQDFEYDGNTFYGESIPADMSVGIPFPPFSLSPDALNASTLNCGVHFNEDGREYCSALNNEGYRENLSFTAILNWEVGDYTLTSVTGYRVKEEEYDEIDLSRIVDGAAASSYNEHKEGEQWSQELRVASNFDGAFNFVAGVYFHDYEFETSPAIDGPFGDCANPIGFTIRDSLVPGGGFCLFPPTFNEDNLEVSSQAVFFDANYDLTETLMLFGGLRWTEQEQDFDRLSYNLGPATPQSEDAKGDEVTGRFGARWTFSDNNMLYASIATGYKPAFIHFADNPAVLPLVVNPEDSTSYEIGTKLSFRDGAVAVNASVFYMEIDDYQAQELTFDGAELVSTPVNIDIESKGFEIEVFTAVTENFQTTVGFLYNNSEYPSGFTDDTGADIGGEQLLEAPETKFTLSGEYFYPLSDGMEAFVNLNAIHKDDIRIATRNDDKYVVDAHWNVGASIGLRSADGKWRISLYGRNLTDEAEPLSAFPLLTFGQDNGGVRVWPAGGVTVRQIGASFDYNF